MSNTEDINISNNDWKKLYEAITEIPNFGENKQSDKRKKRSGGGYLKRKKG